MKMNLRGMAKHMYSRVITAMAADNTLSMCYTFAALPDGAKSIILKSGYFSNSYIIGERKAMAADEAAKELEERAAAIVERKLRKIDHITAVAFLAEYISRKRKDIKTPDTIVTVSRPIYQVQQYGRKTEFKTKRAALKLANDLAVYGVTDAVTVYEVSGELYKEIYRRKN